MIEIAMLVMPGAFHGGVAAMLDCFDLAAERRDRVINKEGDGGVDMRLTVLSPEGGTLVLDKRLTLKTDRPLASTDCFDFVWVPAFRCGGKEALRNRLAGCENVCSWLASQAAQGALVAMSGSANVLAAASGLTRDVGLPVVPALEPTLRSVFPRLRIDANREIVEHDRLLLGKGISTDCELIARAFDRVLSPATGHWLRSVLGRSGEDDGEAVDDPLVETARLWLEQRFAQPVSVSHLAEELHVSHAVLIRRFRSALGVTPSAYVRNLRLATAKRMLSHSNRPVEIIAASVGYADPRNFRQMFRQATGVSARAWRLRK